MNEQNKGDEYLINSLVKTDDMYRNNDIIFIVLELPGAFRAFEWFDKKTKFNNLILFSLLVSDSIKDKLFKFVDPDNAGNEFFCDLKDHVFEEIEYFKKRRRAYLRVDIFK